MHLNHPKIFPTLSMEKLSSMKPVPGKNAGDHCPRILRKGTSLSLLLIFSCDGSFTNSFTNSFVGFYIPIIFFKNLSWPQRPLKLSKHLLHPDGKLLHNGKPLCFIIDFILSSLWQQLRAIPYIRSSKSDFRPFPPPPRSFIKLLI